MENILNHYFMRTQISLMSLLCVFETEVVLDIGPRLPDMIENFSTQPTNSLNFYVQYRAYEAID